MLADRNWRVCNIPGGMKAPLAYAMNQISQPSDTDRYLNIFSGSATLLIERAKMQKSGELIGFDYNGNTNTCAVKNLKAAKVVQSVSIHTHDIYDEPNLREFNVITSDLPFGEDIGNKDELPQLYSQVLRYSLKHIKKHGKIVLFTMKTSIFEKTAKEIGINITKEWQLKLPNSNGKYYYPKIYLITAP